MGKVLKLSFVDSCLKAVDQLEPVLTYDFISSPRMSNGVKGHVLEKAMSAVTLLGRGQSKRTKAASTSNANANARCTMPLHQQPCQRATRPSCSQGWDSSAQTLPLK